MNQFLEKTYYNNKSNQIDLNLNVQDGQGAQQTIQMTLDPTAPFNIFVQLTKQSLFNGNISKPIKFQFNGMVLKEDDQRTLQQIGLENGSTLDVARQQKGESLDTEPILQDNDSEDSINTTKITEASQKNIKITVKVQDLHIEEIEFDLEMDPKSLFSTLQEIVEKKILSQKQLQISILEYWHNGRKLNKNDKRNLDQMDIINESIIEIKVCDNQKSQEIIEITVRVQSEKDDDTEVRLNVARVTPFNVFMIGMMQDNLSSQSFSTTSGGIEFYIGKMQIQKNQMNLSLQELNVKQGSIIDVKFDKFSSKVLNFELIETQFSQIQLNFRILDDNISYPFSIIISDDVTFHVLNERVKQIISNLNLDQIEFGLFEGLQTNQIDNRTIRELGFRHGQCVNLIFDKFTQS